MAARAKDQIKQFLDNSAKFQSIFSGILGLFGVRDRKNWPIESQNDHQKPMLAHKRQHDAQTSRNYRCVGGQDD